MYRELGLKEEEFSAHFSLRGLGSPEASLDLGFFISKIEAIVNLEFML